MNDDIRRPREVNTDEDEFKTQSENNEANTEPDLEATNLYDSEAGFAAAKASPDKTPKNKVLSFHLVKNSTKKQKIIGGVIVVVLLLVGGLGVNTIVNASKPKPQAEAPIVKQEKPPKPTTEASKLTGVQVPIEVNKRPIVSIQIENSPEARPQSGIKDAGVIYEAIAEGGITRFNVSFQEGQPDYIGPVRSVRPYYAVLAAPFDPVFVHAGGSPDGLSKLRELGLKDMDYGANGGAFKRISGRYAPHNLYTSMGDLDRASLSRGYTASNVKSFARKAEKPAAAVSARVVEMNFSSALYNARYEYNPATNSYNRSMGGRPHTDQRSGQQLSPKVVVALVMSFSQNGIYSVYQTTGGGKAYIFQDGVAQEVNWSKAGDKEQFKFTDATGKEVQLNAGQTWIGLVKAPNQVVYAP